MGGLSGYSEAQKSLGLSNSAFDFEKPSKRTTEEPATDVYGFQSDQVSLHDAFKLQGIRFRPGDKEKLPEQAIDQVQLRNYHLWVLTSKNKYIAKT